MSIFFSIVIPTHNGLDLLRGAIETVLAQDYTDWELVIFDNASSEDIAGHVKNLAHPKIRYERSQEFLPVTDSWNRAIDLAKGQYVTLLGNDDGLAPGYFSKMADIISKFDKPDYLYTAIYQFMNPGVLPTKPDGYVLELKDGFFFVRRKAPFLLSDEDRFKAVQGSIGLRRNFGYNMQAQCFSSGFLQRLRVNGRVFLSPFPDYYLANISMARARSVVVIPEPMAIQGVSTVSFGFTLLNNLEEQGAAYLNTAISSDLRYGEVEKYLLPGPLYNTNFVITMQHVVRCLPDYVRKAVAFHRYRRLQIYRLLTAQKGQMRQTAVGRTLWSLLTSREKLWAITLGWFMRTGMLQARLVRRYCSKLEPYGYYPPTNLLDEGRYARLMEYYRALEAKSDKVSTACRGNSRAIQP